MKFNVIITTDTDGGISRYNKLPWYFPEDAAFFEQTTINHVCIMGRRTAIDLKDPLKDRDNIVITQQVDDPRLQSFTVATSFYQALQLAITKAKPIIGKQIFIIGGSRLFNEALSPSYKQNLDKIYYLHISKSFHCDNFIREPILNRSDAITTILDTKNVKSIDTINAINKVGDVTLTFYLIKCHY